MSDLPSDVLQDISDLGDKLLEMSRKINSSVRTEWTWVDVQSLMPTWDQVECQAYLDHCDKALREAMTEVGWGVLNNLLLPYHEHKDLCDATNPDNSGAAERGMAVVRRYAEISDGMNEPMESNLTFMLADIGHMCRARGMDFDNLVEKAKAHTEEESLP